MKKILSFLIIVFLFTNCNVSYDGDERYIFETTVVDSNNNPISNLDVVAYFYSGDYLENNTINLFGERKLDEIISGKTDANGNIQLVFPFAKNRENLAIKIGNYTDAYEQSEFEIVNIGKNNFSNYKLVEPTITIYKSNESIGLNVTVTNTSSNKYVSKIEFDGKKRETVKYYNQAPNDFNTIPVYEQFYWVIKNQNATLKYEVTTIINGQQTKANVEEQIIILENNIDYTITL